MDKILFIFAFIFLFTSCRQANKASQIASPELRGTFTKSIIEEIPFPGQVTCYKGSYSAFTFINAKKSISEFAPIFKTIPDMGGENLSLVQTDDQKAPKIRLDVCVDDNDNTAELKQIILQVTKGGLGGENVKIFKMITPGDDAKVFNLEKAIFGKFDNFLVQVPEEKQFVVTSADGQETKFTHYYVYKIGGVAQEQSEAIYFVDVEVDEDGKIMDYSPQVTIGRLTPGDPFSDLDPESCGPGTNRVGHYFEIPTRLGKVEVKQIVCEYISDMTLRHVAKEIRITDTGAPEPFKGKEFKISVSSIFVNNNDGSNLSATYYTDGTSHHNTCNYFLAKLPHAKYAFQDSNPQASAINPNDPFGCPSFALGVPILEPTIGPSNVFLYQYQNEQPMTLKKLKIRQGYFDITK